MFLKEKLPILAELYLIYLNLTSDSGTFLEPVCACKVPCTTRVNICKFLPCAKLIEKLIKVKYGA